MNESLYDSVLEACALKPDLASFPSGDLTDVAAGGSTISGGQRARVSLARAAYRALVELQQRQSPLVLLDDPFCALDKEVAKQVCRSLLSPTNGLLRRCTVMVAAADPWWLRCLTDVGDVQTGIVILRSGKIFAQGRVAELRPQDLTELKELRDQAEEEEMPSSPQMRNPQDMDEEGEDGDVLPILSPLPQDASRLTPSPRPVKLSEAETQTPLTKEQEIRGSLKVAEGRVAGHVQCATYLNYLKGVGYVNFTVMFVALAGIMLFQNFCSLWIVYWTSEKKDTTFMHSWLT
ncbi:ABCC2, partial [Symbiodinium microadriaticum]